MRILVPAETKKESGIASLNYYVYTMLSIGLYIYIFLALPIDAASK